MTEELFDTLEFVTGSTEGQAHMRNLIGETAADVACRILRAEPLRIDGRKAVCPDFRLGEYEGEIKSYVMKRHRVLAYKFRLEKEAAYCDPSRYLYALLGHRASSNEKSRDEVVRGFMSGVELHCCTLEEVMAVVAGRKTRHVPLPEGVVDSKVGYWREGYRDGFYEFSPAELKPADVEFRSFQICRAERLARCYISAGWKRLFPH